jgi:hypothetical protein
MGRGSRDRRIVVLIVVLAGWSGCYGAERYEDPDAGDGDADTDADADADTDSDGSDPCAPQEAHEDLEVDCDGCDPCDATPYQWDGDRCVFAPICCRCAGADCDALFETLDGCREAHGACPPSVQASLYPESRLLWKVEAGYAGTGPALRVDGSGLVRSWEEAGGIDWGSTGWDSEEDLGVDAANELFALLDEVSFAALPHEPTTWFECYSSLQLSLCDECEPVSLGYQSAPDLLPEMGRVYAWLEERLCRSVDPSSLPGSYCDWDW